MTAEALAPAAGGDESRVRYDGLADLGVEEILAAAGEAMADQHEAAVRALAVDQQFAVLHSSDPRAGTPWEGQAKGPTLADCKANGWTVPQWERACDKLVQVGGDGTPMVAELPICELAVARGVHAVTARNHLADALDLGFRLTGVWAALLEGRGQVWVARRVATASRHLDRDQIKIVDAAVAQACDQAPGRALSIAEAAIMRADPDYARKQAEERARRRYLALGRLQGEDAGLRKVFGLIDAGDAEWLDAMIEKVADALAERPDLTGDHDGQWSRDELRAEALGWLAHPEDVIALLAGSYPMRGEDTPPDGGPEPDRLAATRSRAVLHVHLSDVAVRAALGGRICSSCGSIADTPASVARVEELGPMLLDELVKLLGHARIDLKPVIDLNENRSVNGYEHPPDVHERSFLRSTGDVFPHAQTQSRRVDGDHPKPYDRDGPPGQTGDHNYAPLTRRSHRAKTHQAYILIQLGLSQYLWRTPHGLYRLVDGRGTHAIDEATAWRLVSESRLHSGD